MFALGFRLLAVLYSFDRESAPHFLDVVATAKHEPHPANMSFAKSGLQLCATDADGYPRADIKCQKMSEIQWVKQRS